MKKKTPLTIVLGPTASGKTDFAIQLAQKSGGAVVSADSRQVYAGLNIGTAKPKDAWQDKPHDILEADTVDDIPHYLLNIRSPDQPLSLAEWQAAAYKVLDDLRHAGTPTKLAGGTMLYIDSMIFNYDIPNVQPNPTLRAQLEEQTAAELYDQLKRQDPPALAFIQPKNKRRIIRALEVMAATGKTFSDLRKKRQPRYELEIIGLFLGWNVLEERIRQRARQVLTDGLLEETKKLRTVYGADLPLLRTMNYLEAAAVLDGTMTEPQALEAMIRANLRYARRQMSWWRERTDIRWTTVP